MSSCRRNIYPRSKILLTETRQYYSFEPEDIQPFSAELIDTVLNKLESAGSPEKVAENDFMMKCKWEFDHFSIVYETTIKVS